MKLLLVSSLGSKILRFYSFNIPCSSLIYLLLFLVWMGRWVVLGGFCVSFIFFLFF